MKQLDLLERVPLADARDAGAEAGAACLQKAERVAGFDAEGCGRFIVGWVARYGPTSGESLTRAALEHGFRPHDLRAMGSVFRKLAANHKLKVLRSDLPRERGHGTSGGRLWGLVRV